MLRLYSLSKELSLYRFISGDLKNSRVKNWNIEYVALLTVSWLSTALKNRMKITLENDQVAFCSQS